MKILTVQEPWATMIIYGAKTRRGKLIRKDIENRGKEPPSALKGERIAIHAGLSKARLAHGLVDLDEVCNVVLEESDLTFGAVLGSVQLATWVADSKSIWFGGPVGYVLKDPFAYPKPIPCKGQLGFFTNDAIARTLAKYERLRVAAAEK